MTHFKNFLFSVEKPCKYVHKILYMFNISDDLYSLFHVLIYKNLFVLPIFEAILGARHVG